MQRLLLAWFDEHKRELPWRQTHDPYRIWLSEVILQQTRVVQGLDYYQRFLEHFPDVFALAKAEEDEVLHLWQGLGYYSRGRNLLKAARIVATQGRFPNTFEALRKLPGVGDYTAAAVSSIAYGLPYAVVDGNVLRVLSRFYSLEVPQDTPAGKRTFAALADEWLFKDDPGRHNQAMMELGALVCLPRSPRCEECPLADACQARAEGRQEDFPVRARKQTVRTRHFVYLYPRHERRIFLHRRGGGDIWQGLYEPLLLEFDHRPDFAEVAKNANLPQASTFVLVAEGLRHQLTHQLLLADAYVVKVPAEDSGLDGLWVPETSREDYPVSRLVSLVYKKVDSNIQDEHN